MGSLLDNSLQIISNTTGKSLFVRLWPLSTTPKGKGLLTLRLLQLRTQD